MYAFMSEYEVSAVVIRLSVSSHENPLLDCVNVKQNHTVHSSVTEDRSHLHTVHNVAHHLGINY